MMVYENDILVIPDEYKKMSIQEIEQEKEKIKKVLSKKPKRKKQISINKRNIILNNTEKIQLKYSLY